MRQRILRWLLTQRSLIKASVNGATMLAAYWTTLTCWNLDFSSFLDRFCLLQLRILYDVTHIHCWHWEENAVQVVIFPMSPPILCYITHCLTQLIYNDIYTYRWITMSGDSLVRLGDKQHQISRGDNYNLVLFACLRSALGKDTALRGAQEGRTY